LRIGDVDMIWASLHREKRWPAYRIRLAGSAPGESNEKGLDRNQALDRPVILVETRRIERLTFALRSFYN
jgi:hypothetical protein